MVGVEKLLIFSQQLRGELTRVERRVGRIGGQYLRGLKGQDP